MEERFEQEWQRPFSTAVRMIRRPPSLSFFDWRALAFLPERRKT